MVGVALHFEKGRRGYPQTVDSLLWDEVVRLSIRLTPVIGRNHGDDFLPLIDFVKESPGTNAVAPGWRFPILQSLDIRAVMWVVSQLGGRYRSLAFPESVSNRLDQAWQDLL
jgi:hypothetical protein